MTSLGSSGARLLRALWCRLDLVADDPGIEREWVSVGRLAAMRDATRIRRSTSEPVGGDARKRREKGAA
jgi:hypothetical protein